MVDTATDQKKTSTISVPLLNDKTYNILKHLAAIILPAVLGLYATLADIWGWSEKDKVMATLAALNVLVGAFVTFFRWLYTQSDAAYDGVVNITETDDHKVFQLELSDDPTFLEDKKQIVLKVNAPPAAAPAVPVS